VFAHTAVGVRAGRTAAAMRALDDRSWRVGGDYRGPDKMSGSDVPELAGLAQIPFFKPRASRLNGRAVPGPPGRALGRAACRERKAPGADCGGGPVGRERGAASSEPVPFTRSGPSRTGPPRTFGCGSENHIGWLLSLGPGAAGGHNPSRPCRPRAWGRRRMMVRGRMPTSWALSSGRRPRRTSRRIQVRSHQGLSSAFR
jgi:hypothetical protein